MTSFLVSTKKEKAAPDEPRFGGNALIGGIHEWPVAPDGKKLVLIASLPGRFIEKGSEIKVGQEKIVSVFSYYLPDDYFVDMITYHGDKLELQNILSGYTKVLIHNRGEEEASDLDIPAVKISISESTSENVGSASFIGGNPSFLQNENLALGNMRFCLQLYSSDVSAKYPDILGLSDSVGYLFLNVTDGDQAGLFFMQVT